MDRPVFVLSFKVLNKSICLKHSARNKEMIMTYLNYLEPLIQKFTSGEYQREVCQARIEYFEKAGAVYEEDHEFEPRMDIFIDWYLFDRNLSHLNLSPIQLYYEENKNCFSEIQNRVYQDFCTTIYSIFYFKRITWIRKKLVLFDLLSHQTYYVKKSEMTQGLVPGDIFEARLIPFHRNFELSRGICFHPIEMKPFILKEAKKFRSKKNFNYTPLVFQLSALKVKYFRFSHMNIQDIYRLETKSNQMNFLERNR